MKARHFFDVWCEVVNAVEMTRNSPATGFVFRDNVVARIGARHGDKVAAEAAAYYERLHEDTTRYSAEGKMP